VGETLLGSGCAESTIDFMRLSLFLYSGFWERRFLSFFQIKVPDWFAKFLFGWFVFELMLALDFKNGFFETGLPGLSGLFLIKVSKLQIASDLTLIECLDNGVKLALLDFILDLIYVFFELIEFIISDNLIDKVFAL
jgi:hypothetical protein